MIELLKNIGLMFLSIILAIVFFPIGFLYAILHIIFAYNTKQGFEYCNKLFLSIAISIDQLGNVVCQHLFNMFMINKEGHKFGDTDETVSSVLGRNKQSNTLNRGGSALDSLLNKFEKDHSIKSIGK